MKNVEAIGQSRRGTAICRMAGIALLGAAGLALAAACFWPIDSDAQPARSGTWKSLHALDESPADVDRLIRKMAGRTLVKVAQVQAAVKDSGAAKELVKRLKLQGVVEMPDGLVAYIAVQGEGVATCRKGEKVLEFVVEDVQPGKVTLNLQGVVASLGN